MIKHKYYVSGIYTITGFPFKASCISADIKDAIDLFRSKGYSIHKIEMGEQVSKDEIEKILDVKYKLKQ